MVDIEFEHQALVHGLQNFCPALLHLRDILMVDTEPLDVDTEQRVVLRTLRAFDTNLERLLVQLIWVAVDREREQFLCVELVGFRYVTSVQELLGIVEFVYRLLDAGLKLTGSVRGLVRQFKTQSPVWSGHDSQ